MRCQLDLLFRGTHVPSVAACSTRRCSCVKKGNKNKCGPGCRCENCSNAPSVTGTQQQGSDELVQTEEEELLYDDSLRKEYGEVRVSDEEGGSSLSDADIDEDDL